MRLRNKGMTMRSDHCFATLRRLVAGSCAAVAMSAPLAQIGEWKYDPALGRSPPKVDSAAIALLAKPGAAGNATLRVRFAKGTELKVPSLIINGGLGPTPLRDDGVYPDEKPGDGVFHATVNLDTEQLTAERERRIKLSDKFPSLPRFDGRSLLEWVPYLPPPRLKLEPNLWQPIDAFTGFPDTVDPERELLIRHVSVVEDPLRTYEPCNGTGTPMGAWTFGKLMTEIANQPVTGIPPEVLVEVWVNHWMSDLSINGFTVRGRPVGAQALLDRWPRNAYGKLDLSRSPFRLLAIVNRQDLRGSTLYGASGAGEARLVFGAVDCARGSSWPPQAQGFTVSFEYGVPKSGCADVRDWARQWHNLGTLVFGSPAYNTALQAITDQFTLRDLNPAQLPNRSAIRQVRTNESVLLSGVDWEQDWQLRESRLLFGGLLVHATVAQSPDPGLWLWGTTETVGTALRDFVNANTPDILADRHTVPLQYPAGSPFLGGTAVNASLRADGIANMEARRKFSLATCGACHGVETRTGTWQAWQTWKFTHIRPRAIGAESLLSDFLTGANMPLSTPRSGELRTYHDLLERQARLDATANMSCGAKTVFAIDELFLRPLGPAFVH
jgi:hypothetical protein